MKNLTYSDLLLIIEILYLYQKPNPTIMRMNTVTHVFSCFFVCYCLAVFSSDGKKIYRTKTSLNSNGRSDVVNPTADLKSNGKGVLIKKRKKRLRVQKDEQKSTHGRQMINVESFLGQFNLFSNSSLFSNMGSSNTDQASPTRLVIS